MRNTSIALAIAAALVAAPVFAQGLGPADNGFFVNGTVGHSFFGGGQNSGSDTGYAINGGYRWAVTPNLAIGPEIGYNDLGNIHIKNTFNSNPVISSGKASLHGWTFGGSAKYSFTQHWYADARAGLYAWSGHGLSQSITPDHFAHNSSNSYYAGVGAGYDFNRHFGVGITYDYYHAKQNDVNLSTSVLGVNAEVRF